jgi:CBS domain-containing protein
MSARSPSLHLIPVCTRLVVTRRGRVRASSQVPCPHRSAVDLATCFACPRYLGVEPDGRGAAIACEPRTACAAGGGGPALAVDVMTRDVFCVAADVDIGVVAALLLETGLTAVPVVNDAGCPLGLVSTADVVRAAVPDHRAPRHLALVEDIAPTATAGDAMHRVEVAVRPDETVPAVAARMLANHAQHVPVLDDDGRLIGMLTAIDIARWSAAHLDVPPA